MVGLAGGGGEGEGGALLRDGDGGALARDGDAFARPRGTKRTRHPTLTVNADVVGLNAIGVGGDKEGAFGAEGGEGGGGLQPRGEEHELAFHALQHHGVNGLDQGGFLQTVVAIGDQEVGLGRAREVFHLLHEGFRGETDTCALNEAAQPRGVHAPGEAVAGDPVVLQGVLGDFHTLGGGFQVKRLARIEGVKLEHMVGEVPSVLVFGVNGRGGVFGVNHLVFGQVGEDVLPQGTALGINAQKLAVTEQMGEDELHKTDVAGGILVP